MSARFSRSVVIHSFLVIGSLGVSLAVGEVVLRALEGRASAVHQRIPIRENLLREIYENQVHGIEGVSKQWFLSESPRPIEDLVAVHNDFAGIDIGRDRAKLMTLGTNYPKAHNIEVIRNAVCQSPMANQFKDSPVPVFAFKLEPTSWFPRYRFMPSARHASGLVTNRFGHRSPDIEWTKKPGVIRIAFVGASTTVNHPNINHSYPEYVGHWLNVWSRENRLGVVFETINAGRDASTIDDNVEIVRSEVLPLGADVVVHYANEFAFRSLIRNVSELEKLGPFAALMAERTTGPIPWLIAHSAIVRKLEPLLMQRISKRRAEALRYQDGLLIEMEKPDYEIDPAVVPPHIRENIKTMARDVRAAGGLFAISSFVWLAHDGLKLDPTLLAVDPRRDWWLGGIYGYLNWFLYPVRYADVRRFADIQNQAFQEVSEESGAVYLSVAEQFPQDQRLFFDAVHMTEEGVRLRAWITFLELTNPILKAIEEGKLPIEPRSAPIPTHMAEGWAFEVKDITTLPCDKSLDLQH